MILIKIRKNLISDLIKDFYKASSLDSKSFKYLKDFCEEKTSFYCNLALSHYHQTIGFLDEDKAIFFGKQSFESEFYNYLSENITKILESSISKNTYPMEELFPFSETTTRFIYWKFYVLFVDRKAERILLLRSSGIKSFKENMSYLSTSTSIDDNCFNSLTTNSLNSQSLSIEKLATTAINNNINNDDVKENKTMNLFSNINLDCGPINSDRIQMSPYGAAIKSSDGWKAYDRDNNCIISVDGFTFDFGKTPMFYKIPVSPDMVFPGDLIVHNKKCLYVKGFKDPNEKNSGIYAVDIASNEEKVILPSKNIFNFNFIMKIVSMLDMGGNSIFNTMRPTESNPFGAYFQMMIMSEMMSGEKGDFDFGKMLMLQSMCGGGFNFPFIATNNNS